MEMKYAQNSEAVEVEEIDTELKIRLKSDKKNDSKKIKINDKNNEKNKINEKNNQNNNDKNNINEKNKIDEIMNEIIPLPSGSIICNCFTCGCFVCTPMSSRDLTQGESLLSAQTITAYQQKVRTTIILTVI